MKWLDKLLREDYHKPLRDFFKAHAGKLGTKLITIGYNNDEPSRNWIHFFRDDLGFQDIMIVEAHHPSARKAEQYYLNSDNIKVYTGTIQSALDDEVWWKTHGDYNTCLFSHGFEHLSIADNKMVLDKLSQKLDTLYMSWAPWGSYYGEGEHHVNPYQRHQIVDPTPEIAQQIDPNLQVFTCDQYNSPNGLVVIYKWFKV